MAQSTASNRPDSTTSPNRPLVFPRPAKKRFPVWAARALVVLFFFTSCASYYRRPYERRTVSIAQTGQTIFSEVKIIYLEGKKQTNYSDYYYQGAEDRTIRVGLREYFNERSGRPQVNKSDVYPFTDKKPEVRIGKKILKIYEATDEQLVFRIDEAN